MKRWLRRLWLTVYHTFSFVWFAVAIVLVSYWIRSYWVHDVLGFGSKVILQANESEASRTWVGFRNLQSLEGEIRYQAFRYRYLPQKKTDGVEPDDHVSHIPSNFSSFPLWESIHPRWGPKSSTGPPGLEIWRFAGLAYYRDDEPPEPTIVPGHLYPYPAGNPVIRMHWSLILPYWLITLIISLWPLIWLLLLARGVRNLNRMARGHCGKCNYDLRGAPAPDKCPECGTASPACVTRSVSARGHP